MKKFNFLKRVVPESPRWLLATKRKKEAYKVFNTIAKWNKKRREDLTSMEELLKVHKIESEVNFIAEKQVDKFFFVVNKILFVCFFLVHYMANFKSIFFFKKINDKINGCDDQLAWQYICLQRDKL